MAAWDTILKDRREMKPYFLFPEDKTEAANVGKESTHPSPLIPVI
jgi:hypothetical protein